MYSAESDTVYTGNNRLLKDSFLTWPKTVQSSMVIINKILASYRSEFHFISMVVARLTHLD